MGAGPTPITWSTSPVGGTVDDPGGPAGRRRGWAPALAGATDERPIRHPDPARDLPPATLARAGRLREGHAMTDLSRVPVPANLTPRMAELFARLGGPKGVERQEALAAEEEAKRTGNLLSVY